MHVSIALYDVCTYIWQIGVSIKLKLAVAECTEAYFPLFTYLPSLIWKGAFSPKPQPFFVQDYGDMNKMKYLDQYTLLTLLLRAAVVYAKKKT